MCYKRHFSHYLLLSHFSPSFVWSTFEQSSSNSNFLMIVHDFVATSPPLYSFHIFVTKYNFRYSLPCSWLQFHQFSDKMNLGHSYHDLHGLLWSGWERTWWKQDIFFYLFLFLFSPLQWRENLSKTDLEKSPTLNLCNNHYFLWTWHRSWPKNIPRIIIFIIKMLISMRIIISIWSWQQSWKYTKNFRFGDGGGFDAIGCQSSRNFHRDFNPKKIGFLFTS